MKNYVEISADFSSAHFYHQARWSNERNLEEFGRCFTPHGHGHNYHLQVEFLAPKDINSLSALDSSQEGQTILEAVLDEANRLDHKHLNHDIPEFHSKVPTTENIASYLMERLQKRRLPWSPTRLRLYEMSNLWVEIINEKEKNV